MGSWSIGHWLIVLVIVLLLFGANKIPKLMGDMAKGVKAFKQGLKEGEEESAAQPAPQPQASVQAQPGVTQTVAAQTAQPQPAPAQPAPAQPAPAQAAAAPQPDPLHKA